VLADALHGGDEFLADTLDVRRRLLGEEGGTAKEHDRAEKHFGPSRHANIMVVECPSE